MTKKLLAGIMLLSTSLMADYELFTSYTKPLNQINAKNSTVVFSGKYEDYVKEIGKNTALSGAWGAAVGAASMGVAGGVVGGIVVVAAFELSDDQQFIQVTKIDDGKGNYSLKRTLLVCDKNPSLSVAQATNIMTQGK